MSVSTKTTNHSASWIWQLLSCSRNSLPSVEHKYSLLRAKEFVTSPFWAKLKTFQPFTRHTVTRETKFRTQEADLPTDCSTAQPQLINWWKEQQANTSISLDTPRDGVQGCAAQTGGRWQVAGLQVLQVVTERRGRGAALCVVFGMSRVQVSTRTSYIVTEGFCGFPQPLQAHTLRQIRQRLLPSSLIILQFDTT